MGAKRTYVGASTAACLFLLLFGLDVGIARAQANAIVRGQVVAAADHSGLSGIALTLTSRSGSEPFQAMSDATGRFAFSSVPPGEYVLSAAGEGFSPRQWALVVAPREVRALTVALGIAPVAVAIDVVGDEPTPGTHSPSSTLLTGERLDQMPLAQRTNLPDAIVTAAPGMIRGHDDFVHIRGHEVALNPSINGVQFWENAHSVFSPGLGVDYIESINVMTGGFSGRIWQSFRRDPRCRHEVRVHDAEPRLGLARHRHRHRHNAGLEFGAERERVAYYLNVGGFASEPVSQSAVARSIHNTGRGVRAFGRLDVRRSDRDHFDLVLTGDGVNFELPNGGARRDAASRLQEPAARARAERDRCHGTTCVRLLTW